VAGERPSKLHDALSVRTLQKAVQHMTTQKKAGRKKAEGDDTRSQPAPAPAAPDTRQGNRPVGVIKLGRIRVSIWRNHSAQYGDWFSFTLARTYKDQKTGEFRNASSFGVDDLLLLGEVCRQARWWYEDEQARQRQQQAQAAHAAADQAEGKGDAWEPPASGDGAPAPPPDSSTTQGSSDIPF
jgi:hypothetical protein